MTLTEIQKEEAKLEMKGGQIVKGDIFSAQEVVELERLVNSEIGRMPGAYSEAEKRSSAYENEKDILQRISKVLRSADDEYRKQRSGEK